MAVIMFCAPYFPGNETTYSKAVILTLISMGLAL